MSTIDPTSVNPYDSLGLGSKKTEAKGSDGLQDQFMTLMLTQMKNQDPLKPMENGEFLAQLAQFNTVTGVQELQKSFSDFAASMQTNQALQASSLVGREVAVPGPDVMLNSGSNVQGSVMLPASTPNLQLSVYDGSGQLVRTIGMGTQASGEVPFSWDGLANDGTALPSGVYHLSAEAPIDGETTALATRIDATVESVSMAGGAQGIQLNLAGIGTRPFSDVQQVK